MAKVEIAFRFKKSECVEEALPIAMPPMNAASTILIAVAVEPNESNSSRVQQS